MIQNRIAAIASTVKAEAMSMEAELPGSTRGTSAETDE
jgi:hypothetical protein